MSVVTCNATVPSTGCTQANIYNLINTATVSSIQGTDISASANIQNSSLATLTQSGLVNVSALTGQIANSNLAQLTSAALVTGAALTLLPNIPSGAGIIPQANVGGLLGSWTSKNVGTTYQALTDGIVVVTFFGSGDTSGGYFVTDSSSSPSTTRGTYNANTNTGEQPNNGTITCPVRKNDYYEAVVSTGTSQTMYFISLGS